MNRYQTMSEIMDELKPSNQVMQRWLQEQGAFVGTSQAKAVAEAFATSHDTKTRIAEMMAEEAAAFKPEACPVCQGDEPCSHDFDKDAAALQTVGASMGARPAPEPHTECAVCHDASPEAIARCKEAMCHPSM